MKPTQTNTHAHTLRSVPLKILDQLLHTDMVADVVLIADEQHHRYLRQDSWEQCNGRWRFLVFQIYANLRVTLDPSFLVVHCMNRTFDIVTLGE